MTLPSPFVAQTNNIYMVVECPKGSHNKFTYVPESGLFKLSKTFPAGVTFPFDFGFIPNTKAGDGDPFDVILLTDEPLFPGCLAEGRVIGVIEAEQHDEGKLVRNDRVIAVSVESYLYEDIHTLEDLPKNFLDDAVDFISSYQKRTEHHFTPLRFSDAQRAIELIKNTVM